MDLKKLMILNECEWIKSNKKLVLLSALLFVTGIYLSPLVKEARLKNKCIFLAQKELISLTRSQVLTPREEAFVAAYQICNHRT